MPYLVPVHTRSRERFLRKFLRDVSVAAKQCQHSNQSRLLVAAEPHQIGRGRNVTPEDGTLDHISDDASRPSRVSRTVLLFYSVAQRRQGRKERVRVAGRGFEPLKAYAGDFTDRSLWPLGHPAMASRGYARANELREYRFDGVAPDYSAGGLVLPVRPPDVSFVVESSGARGVPLSSGPAPSPANIARSAPWAN